ncbi:MAG: hypothetical protein WBG86_11155 [Polyangiales bacterium]
MAFSKRAGNHSWPATLLPLVFIFLAGCSDSGAPATGGTGTAGTPGTGGTAGAVGGCQPCTDATAELADNGCDDNCNGLVDEGITCDSQLAIDGELARDGARAMDFCEGAMTDMAWGVISLGYEMPAGEAPPGPQMAEFALGHGLLNGFGTSTLPRSGLRMLALSSGAARDVADPGYQSRDGLDKGYLSSQPPGFPLDVPACGVAPGALYDGISLSVEVRVPPNASGFAFDHAFFTADFPDLVCSEFSDGFAVLLDPAPPGVVSGNLLLDDDGNPIGVNSTFIDSCACEFGPPCDAGGITFDCSTGTTILTGTGMRAAPQRAGLPPQCPRNRGARYESALRSGIPEMVPSTRLSSSMHSVGSTTTETS